MNPEQHEDEDYPIEDYRIANKTTVVDVLTEIEDWEFGEKLYAPALSAIESMSSIRKGRTRREVRRSDSRGGKLKRLEDSIATLDDPQSKAVVETVDGVQRIRGLAGSGKTIVLARKAGVDPTVRTTKRPG